MCVTGWKTFAIVAKTGVTGWKTAGTAAKTAVTGAKTYKGYDAYRAMAFRLPVLWPVLPLLFLWPVPQVGRRIYRSVNRHASGVNAGDFGWVCGNLPRAILVGA